jgi:hypothetical protein
VKRMASPGCGFATVCRRSRRCSRQAGVNGGDKQRHPFTRSCQRAGYLRPGHPGPGSCLPVGV